MPEIPNRRTPKKGPEPSQAPLWFIIIGLGIAIFSRGMKDELIGNLTFWFGVVLGVIAVLYWIFRPRHGL